MIDDSGTRPGGTKRGSNGDAADQVVEVPSAVVATETSRAMEAMQLQHQQMQERQIADHAAVMQEYNLKLQQEQRVLVQIERASNTQDQEKEQKERLAHLQETAELANKHLAAN